MSLQLYAPPPKMNLAMFLFVAVVTFAAVAILFCKL